MSRDLLTIIAKEQADNLRAQGAVVDATGNLLTTPFDERIPALLLIGVLAMCWNGLSAARAVKQAAATAPQEPLEVAVTTAPLPVA